MPVGVEERRYVASQIPGARFVELPGEWRLFTVGRGARLQRGVPYE